MSLFQQSDNENINAMGSIYLHLAFKRGIRRFIWFDKLRVSRFSHVFVYEDEFLIFSAHLNLS